MTSIAERHPAAGEQPALAALARDAAFGRIGRARRWLLLAAVAMTAGFAALASSLLPGKSLGATGAHGRPRTPSGRATQGSHTAVAAPALPAPAGAAQLGLQGPAQAPQSAPPAPMQSAPPATQSSPPPASAPAAPAPAAPSGGVISGGS